MKTFKTEFHPTAQQQEYIRKACGIRRWTWNWAVATYFEEAKKDNFLTHFDLQKQLNNGPVLDPAYSWLSEVNSMTRAETLKDFGLAIKAYADARHRAKRTVDKLPVEKYKPHFKKKGKCAESFRLMKKNETVFKVHSAHDFSMTTTRGRQRLHIHPLESIEFLVSADIKTCTISMQAGKFFISLAYEKTNQRQLKCGTGKAGIDLGVRTAATIYDGSNFKAVHVAPSLSRAERATELWNKRLAKTRPGSKRHQKVMQSLQRAYLHEANVKKDWREKFTTWLARTYGQINIDNFDFHPSDGAHAANRALYRVGSYAFKLRLNDKAVESGCNVQYIPRFTPTTQTCSVCGERHHMDLDDEIFECPFCGIILGRDENSAIKAYNYFV